MVEVTALPFCKHLGLEPVAIDQQQGIRLEPGQQHLNHLGTIHAGVLFSVAESAAAQAMVETFPELVDQAVVVLRSATVKYRHPANGPVQGLATIEADAADTLRSHFAKKGMARLDVSASVRDAEQEVLVGSYTWFITRQDANN